MPARHSGCALALTSLLLTFGGCVNVDYQIEMSLDEDGRLHRRVSGWRQRQEDERTIIESVSDEELAAMGADYGASSVTDDEGRVTFTGVFQGTTPNDVGGAGTVATWTNSLGTMTVYSERIRGSDDLANRWEERQRRIDRLCELMGGWARENAAYHEDGAELDEFISGPLRDDLRNVAMHYWTIAASEPLFEQDAVEPFVRLMQFGIEHGYLTADDLPKLLRFDSSAPREQIDFVVDILDRKRGPHARPLPEVLPVLKSPQWFEDSIADYMQRTPEYAEAIDPDDDVAARRQKALQVPSGLLLSALFMDEWLGFFDNVAIRFNADQEPYQTNGQWDAEQRCVTWNHSVESRGLPPRHVLPVICFAIWAVPAVEFQESHFGRVVFEGDGLAGYCIWHASLTEDEAHQWTDFIAGISPSDELTQAFDQFRFDGEPHSTEEHSLLSDTPRELLRAALGVE